MKKHPLLKTLTLLWVSLALSSQLQAQTTTTLTPTADTYTQQGTPDTNYGSQTTLLIRKDSADTLTRGAYLQFDLSSLPAGTITSATLRLYGSQDTGGTGGVSVKAIAATAPGTWGETVLTYNNSLTLTGADFTATPIATTAISPPPATTYSWNVTSFITSRRALGNATIGLAYTAPNTYRATFNSRQAAANRPQLVVVTTPRANWSMYGRDHANTRASTSQWINSTNVASLEVVRRIHDSGVTGNPAVVDDVVYYADHSGNLKAVNFDTGAIIWSRRLQTGAFTASPYVSGDTVYIGGVDSIIYAVNRTNGTVRWATPSLESTLNDRLWSSPIVVGNKLIIGLASFQVGYPATPLFHGSVIALDINNNGRVLWQRSVCPPATCAAGGSVWSSAAVDEELRHIYIGTGQAYFAPAGPYTDSVVAINYDTGEFAWTYQITPNDVYAINSLKTADYDVGAAPNLFQINGRKVVGVGEKGGRYLTLDRQTGQLVWQTRVGNPGQLGGVMGPAAYANGTIYVVSNTRVATFDGTRDSAYPAGSIAYALDANTGVAKWATTMPNERGVFGGVSVANGLMYFVTYNGWLRVINTNTGELVRSIQLGLQTGVWDPAVKGFPDGSASGPAIYRGSVIVGYGWTWIGNVAGGLTILRTSQGIEP